MAEEVSVSPDNYGYVKGSYTNNGDYDDFDEGESYLELSNTEEDMLDTVCSQFDNVIVVVNANNAQLDSSVDIIYFANASMSISYSSILHLT